MGNYNPHAPAVLGEEWVPIRDENIFISPAVNVVEQGHGFVIPTSRTLQDARFYLNQFPSASFSVSQAYQIALYAKGTETLTGPVRTIDIPVNNGGVTGNTLLTGASIADALWTAADDNRVTLSGGTPANANLDLYFATNSYAQLLNGKRILNVSMVYTLEFSGNVATPFNGEVNVYQVPNPYGVRYGSVSDGTLNGPIAGPGVPVYTFIDMGEVSPFWQTGDVNQTTERLPWTYSVLQRFEITSPNRLTFRWNGFSNPSGTALFLEYCAMRVTYCEEQRLVIGGTQFGGFSSPTLNSIGKVQTLGNTNIVTMRSLPTFAASPVLPAGAYSIVLSAPDIGAPDAKNSPYALLNAVRELYDLPTQEGVQVNLTQIIGDTFTKQSLPVLPQLSLHTSTGPIAEVHSYGRQVAAQVYGAVTATQEIYDDISGVNASYPQVRYYARRFGDTTVPLTLSGTGIFTASIASITPGVFDQLDEIIDGWREVNLRFNISPTMGAATGTPGWTWSAAGETIGNRWEVLGASAPAISGVAGNNYNLVPSPHQLTTTTYQPPSGATVELTWVPQGIGSPPVSGMSSDITSDAVLMFSQDPLTITGVAINTTTQALTGFTDCGRGPCCIPTAISYNRITWPFQLTGYSNDSFTRTVVAGFGSTTETNQAYTLTGTAADFNVNGSSGTIQPSTVSSRRIAVLNVGSPNQDITVDWSVATLPATNSFDIMPVLRYTDVNNFYWGGPLIGTGGAISYVLNKIVAGVVTTLVFTATTLIYVPGTVYSTRAKISDSLLQFKIWPKVGPEPDVWSFTSTDVSLTTGNFGGFLFSNGSAVTTHVATFDNLKITTPNYQFGSYELQRNDPVTNQWQTIMLATSPIVTGFSDYEARVGVTSSYQIRQMNMLDFAGPWSVTGTATISEPGVTMPSCGTNKRGILIFTSNESQVGAYNLAYAMTWTDSPSEDFQFVEAGTIEFTQQFDRDFQVAFHGSERGGEVFSRTLLLANAAVPLPRLGDVHALRDMAWADLSYVCVRDDIGDRWFAAVIVPQSMVKRKRRLYNAPITVVEVTDTASPVNP